MLIGGGSSAIWVFFWKSTNKDAAAVQNVSAGEAMEGIVLAIESGASRGLRTLGLWAGIWTAHKLQ